MSTAISIKDLATRTGLPRAKLRKALRALEYEQELIASLTSVEVCFFGHANVDPQNEGLTSGVIFRLESGPEEVHPCRRRS